MGIAWPNDDYLMLLGRVVYAVASLEGLVVFDMPRMPNRPNALAPQNLATQSTGQLGRALRTHAAQVEDEQWRAYVHASGQALSEIAERRNAVIHARPATVEGQQRLYRWFSSDRMSEAFGISVAHLEELLEFIDIQTAAVHHLRPVIEP